MNFAASFDIPEGQGTNSESVALISSTLSLIVHMAQFVEQASESSSSLGTLSLAVLAKTRKSQGSCIQDFLLWGPRLPSFRSAPNTVPIPDGSAETLGTSSSNVRENSGLIGDVPPQNTVDPDPLNQEQDISCSSLGEEVRGTTTESHILHYPNPDRSIPDGTNVAQILDENTSKCLSLLLDASGVTSHPSYCHEQSLSSVPASVLAQVVRNTMEEFKN